MEELEAAKKEWYDRLTNLKINLIVFSSIRVILEVGCGQGNLTIPLMKKLGTKYEIVSFDLAEGQQTTLQL